MCGFRIRESKKKAHKKTSRIVVHPAPTSNVSITSHDGPLNIGPPPAPAPKPPLPPQLPPTQNFTQHTSYSIPCPSGPYSSSFPQASSSNGLPFTPNLYDPFGPPGWSRERRRSGLFREIDFVKELTEKLAPPKPALTEHKPSPTEQNLLAEIAEMRHEWKEKERKEEVDGLIKSAKEEGLRQGRAERDLGSSGTYALAHDGNSRAHESSQWMPDMATSFLAGIGAEALRGGRHPRPRSRSRSRGRHRSPRYQYPTYIHVLTNRRGSESLGEISGRLGKIEDSMQHVKRRVAHQDFESDLDRMRFGMYHR